MAGYTVIQPLANATGIVKSCESVVGVDVIRGRLGLWVFVRSDQKQGGGIWDFAAPTIILQEAGGVASTPHGDALEFDRIPMNGIVFAANEDISSRAIELMRSW